MILALAGGFTILFLGGVIIWPVKETEEPLAMVSHDHELLNELNDLKNEKKYFSSILSHDLRSPLSSIVLLASYLKSKGDQADTSQYIELIEQSARKELEMMAILLSLMRVDSITTDNLQAVNLRTEAEMAVQSLALHFPEKHKDVNIGIDPELSVAVSPTLVSLILKSLVHQALQFSDPGRSIEIRAMEDADSVKIEIEMISGALANEIGERLFHSDRLSNQHGGKSFPDIIDLYFCRKVAGAYNGTIHVQADGDNPIHRFVFTLDRRLLTKIA
ncbi:HAMP domain-containing histidine kinase [Flavihumibacter sp. R14]|nr:HAMP domain-containing histidine kinase [Flavihumibacter soli]